MKHIGLKLYLFSIYTVFLMAVFAVSTNAQTIETIEYKDGETILEGYLALPENRTVPVPGILIVHQWMGLTDHEKETANRLAKLGYAAFACDIYGKNERPSNPAEAGQFAGKYKGNIELYRQRLNVAMNTLKNRPEVDAEKTAVMGYCFGGTGALELARSGADIKAAVSMHGGLSTSNPEDAKNIKATVLVCHGADDTVVPDKELLAFMDEMRNADIDWYLMIFGNAVHGFTHRNDTERYNKNADERSWNAMMDLFSQVF